MTETTESQNLPAQIADAIVAIPKGLVPIAVKALDRLVGATVDIPVAWLGQQKAKIEAQTEAYRLVEASIANAAALEAGTDSVTVRRALDVLVRKSYRKQVNREAVAVAMVEDLSTKTDFESTDKPAGSTGADVNEDWLNVFERYAEDASSERMQQLWGRVLAGEIRKPGRFSTRTLRFLSEFSQADALTFEDFCKHSFGDAAPKKLVQPGDIQDIRHLIYMESNGLVQGASGLGLSRRFKIASSGEFFIREGNVVILFKGQPNTIFQEDIVTLTPLGQELVTLLPNRDSRAAARAVALAMRTSVLEEAYLGTLQKNKTLSNMEILWTKSTPIQ